MIVCCRVSSVDTILLKFEKKSEVVFGEMVDGQKNLLFSGIQFQNSFETDLYQIESSCYSLVSCSISSRSRKRPEAFFACMR